MLIFSVVIFVFSTLTLWLSSLPWTGDIAVISLSTCRQSENSWRRDVPHARIKTTERSRRCKGVIRAICDIWIIHKFCSPVPFASKSGGGGHDPPSSYGSAAPDSWPALRARYGLPTSVRRSSCSHISKTKQYRSTVTVKYCYLASLILLRHSDPTRRSPGEIFGF